MAEMNVLSHLGKPIHVRVMQIPKFHGSGCFDVRILTNGSHECLPTINCPNPQAVCAKYALRFTHNTRHTHTHNNQAKRRFDFHHS